MPFIPKAKVWMPPMHPKGSLTIKTKCKRLRNSFPILSLCVAVKLGGVLHVWNAVWVSRCLAVRADRDCSKLSSIYRAFQT